MDIIMFRALHQDETKFISVEAMTIVRRTHCWKIGMRFETSKFPVGAVNSNKKLT